MEKDKWIQRVETSIQRLKDYAPEDRLGLLTGISMCWLAVMDSQAGWGNWLKNLQLLNKMPEDMLREFFKDFRSHAVDFLEFDIEACHRIQTIFPKKKADDEEPTGIVV